jgi:hypothetical protein
MILLGLSSRIARTVRIAHERAAGLPGQAGHAAS